MSALTLLDAAPEGTVDFEFLIDERYANINGVMLGGAAGVIFDMCTTTALGPLARPGFWECVLLIISPPHFPISPSEMSQTEC
jgi:hypothetical protein